MALALEDRYAGRLLDHVGELAEHYRQAGPAHARSGWVFARRAAQAAAAQSAHDEALRLYREAADLQELDPTATAPEREENLVGRSVALIQLGRPIEAWPLVAAAADSALARDDVEAAARALLTITVDSVWGWRNQGTWDDERDRACGRGSSTACRPGTRPGRCSRARWPSSSLYKPGMLDRATALADEAVAVVAPR